MQKFNSLLVWVCVAGFVLGLAGCSESDSLASGKRLLAAVHNAQNDIERAMRLMASTGPGMKMLPEVLDVLSGASNSLSSAISKNPDAGPETLYLAGQVMTRINSMQGQYHGAAMDVAVSQVDIGLDDLNRSAALLANQAGMVKYYEELSSRDMSDIDNIVAQANSDTRNLELQNKRIGGQLVKLKQQYEQLIAANRELELDARQIRQGLLDAPSREVLEKALATEKEVVTNSGEITKLEGQISEVESSSQKLEMELAASLKRVEFISQARASQIGQTKKGASSRDKTLADIATSKQDISQRLKDVIDSLKEVDDAKKEAIRHFTSSANLTGQNKSSYALASKAQMHSETGSVRTRSIILGLHCQRVARSVRNAFIKADLTEPVRLNRLTVGITEERSAAVESYKLSADLFEKAGRGSRKDKWHYQILQAEAILGQYRITAGREMIEPINNLLKEASDNAPSDEDKVSAQQVANTLMVEVAISDPQAMNLLPHPTTTETEPEVELETEPETEPEAEPETEPEAELETEPEAELEAEPETELETEPVE